MFSKINNDFKRKKTARYIERESTMGIEFGYYYVHEKPWWNTQYHRIALHRGFSYNRRTVFGQSPQIVTNIGASMDINIGLTEWVGKNTESYSKTVYDGLNSDIEGLKRKKTKAENKNDGTISFLPYYRKHQNRINESINNPSDVMKYLEDNRIAQNKDDESRWIKI